MNRHPGLSALIPPDPTVLLSTFSICSSVIITQNYSAAALLLIIKGSDSPQTAAAVITTTVTAAAAAAFTETRLPIKVLPNMIQSPTGRK